MPDTTGMLADVKVLLGIPGSYHDALLTGYVSEVRSFLAYAGVADSDMTAGVISRGVIDLWNFGAGGGVLSEYFIQRAAQLALSGGGSNAV